RPRTASSGELRSNRCHRFGVIGEALVAHQPSDEADAVLGSDHFGSDENVELTGRPDGLLDLHAECLFDLGGEPRRARLVASRRAVENANRLHLDLPGPNGRLARRVIGPAPPTANSSPRLWYTSRARRSRSPQARRRPERIP